jgi:CBS domain-containing protein
VQVAQTERLREEERAVATRVGEVMQQHVVSVGVNTPLIDVYRLFVEEEISGAPVIDEEGTLVGVISSTDLLRAVEEEHDSGGLAHHEYFRDLLPYSSPDWSSAPDDFQDRLGQDKVEDVMTREVLTIRPDASAAEAARLLRENGVHRLFVTDKEQLLGVLSAFDLLALLEQQA